jgi:hypothetical protein
MVEEVHFGDIGPAVADGLRVGDALGEDDNGIALDFRAGREREENYVRVHEFQGSNVRLLQRLDHRLAKPLTKPQLSRLVEMHKVVTLA